ncbi:FecR domain-containing protein [candidate division KSB1 bacterium]|nr:FecR domain-containing protein [candidate division KSB1 bacterium]
MSQENHEIVSLLADESFQRWLSGNASDEEIRRWNEWLNTSPRHYELHAQAAALWKMAHFRSSALPDVEAEWQTLLRRVEFKAAKAVARDRSFAKRAWFGYMPSRRLAWAGLGAVAALSIALLWRNLPFHLSPKKQEIQLASTNYGQRLELNLPEGSTIILNANSSLCYPAVWTATTARQFELQGEAYFEVSSRPQGPQHDFIVRTYDGAVQVVGTQFTVHNRGQGTRVVVEEGGVEVAVADTSSGSKIPIARTLVEPGHLLHFQKGNRDAVPQPVHVGFHTTWWREHLVLQDTPFEQIIRRLEETHGIQIKIEDRTLLKRTLSGSIENRNLEVVTEALAKALRTSVRREGQMVIFNNLPKANGN